MRASFLTKTYIGRHFELFWLLQQKCRPLYHPPDIWTEDNSTTKGTDGNLMRQTGNNAFNLSFRQIRIELVNFPSEPKPHSITDVIPWSKKCLEKRKLQFRPTLGIVCARYCLKYQNFLHKEVFVRIICIFCLNTRVIFAVMSRSRF